MLPLGERPLLVRVGVHYKFSKLLVDRVEAVDGTYDVLFIGTGTEQREWLAHFKPGPAFYVKYYYLLFVLSDSGLVLKAIHLPREHGQSQEVTLEQLQVFQVQQNIKEIKKLAYFSLISDYFRYKSYNLIHLHSVFWPITSRRLFHCAFLFYFYIS